MKTQIRGVVVAILLTLCASLLVAIPTAGAQEDAPEITMIELRPNRSLFVQWTHTDANGYDLSIVPAGQDPVYTKYVPGLTQDGASIRRVLSAGAEWPAVPGAAYDIAVRESNVQEWSDPVPVSVPTGLAMQVVAAPANSGNSVDLSWTPVSGAEPFVRYEVFIAEETESLASCIAGTVQNAFSPSITLTSKGACAPGAIPSNQDFTVGVRTVQNEVPLVVTSIEAATASTFGGEIGAERYRTAQVGQTWSIVDQAGQTVVWNGTNLRRGDGNSFVNSFNEFFAMRDAGFDSIRVVMNWDRFQPSYDYFDPGAFGSLDIVIQGAAAAGLDVILDPVHIAGSGRWHIPWWAWQQTDDGSNNSSSKMLEAIDENVHPYLTYVTQRYRDDPHVAAIDLLNEPRESVYNQLASNNVVLMDVYHDMIETVRDLDADRPLILGAFYGSAAITEQTLGSVRDATIADPAPVASEFDHLIWSFHDYYIGNEGNPWSDGLNGLGYPQRGRGQFGTLNRSESWDGTGCYPSGWNASSCSYATSRPGLLIPSMRSHMARHVDVAQAAAMPVFVGEYGIPHPGGGRQGWSGGEMFFTDKVAVFDELGLSRTVWAWSTQADQTYGMYDRNAGSLHPWAVYAVGAAQVPLPGDGDVSCDATRTIADALLIAQYAVGNRAGAPDNCNNGAISLDGGDVNSDQRVNIVDALIISQCVALVVNPHC